MNFEEKRICIEAGNLWKAKRNSAIMLPKATLADAEKGKKLYPLSKWGAGYWKSHTIIST